jgi:PAS domain S-box-containing protein
VDRDRVAAAFADARDDGRLDVEFRLQTDGGEQRWIAACAETVGADGESGALAGVFTDVTERKRREEELRRYRRIVEASSDPVYVLDEEGRFEFVDDAFTAATGFDREAILGEHVSTLLSDDEIEHGQEIITALQGSDIERGVFECQIETAYGTERWCEINIALLEDADGEIDGTVGIVRDVTERKERERELERQTERLEEFASVVAHDLRNPLTVAIGHTDVLQEEYDDEFLGRVADAHERMERLIDDLLALAREGRLVDETEPVAVAAIADDAWATAATAGAELAVEAEATVEADADRLRTLFENLFRNAIDHGGDDVTVTVGDIDGDARGFYVADDGPGIPAEDRETVFERGYSTEHGGTGFGLAIVREIADAHGWSISATESDDGGVADEEDESAARQSGSSAGARFEVTGIEPV